MKKLLLILFASILVPLSVGAQEIIPLYQGAIPNSKAAATTLVKESFSNGMYRNVTTPTLEVFLPEKGKETGAAVVICAGGGYSVIVYSGEGVMTAKELAKNGVAAFVLKYRLPDDAIMNDKSIGPLQDAQQAIKVVRENAVKWSVNPNKIGIIGFSAGGHLASTEATHFKKALIENPNSTSLRPDFQVVVYPVISMQEKLTHSGSRTQLLGNNPSKETVDLFSNELQVDETTPPTYITQAADDKTVDVDNSIVYFEALRHHNVPVEMHIYPKGGHGFVFGHKGWMEPLLQWIESTTKSTAK
ncbi:alpha/beta hydrolase [Paludibacter sp.]|uniref:alpha/beta hydrolase n=1 Tax=Paludibacter sp. TaxID=1898105 RepID=UPI001353A920|nr:alpha/beta hydrolase [Paludibacter sp.]MTK54313.1 alpha/beta hydrolase [Paludibacter sp.]